VSSAIISNASSHTPSVEEEEQDADKTMEAPTLGMQQQRSQSEQPSLEEFLSYVGLEKLLPVLQVRLCC